MVKSQDIEVVQGAVRYLDPSHGAGRPLPLNYSLRPFFLDRVFPCAAFCTAKRVRTLRNRGRRRPRGATMAARRQGRRLKRKMGGGAEALFFLTDQVSLGCVECPRTFTMRFLVQRAYFWVPKAYLAWHFSGDSKRTNIKRPRASISLRLRTLCIDNKPQICIGEAV